MEHVPSPDPEKIDLAIGHLKVLDALIEEILQRKVAAEADCQIMAEMQRAHYRSI
jgi:hypothetical protein